jgi:hypothetical protein
MAALPDDSIVQRLATLPGWEREGDENANTY